MVIRNLHLNILIGLNCFIIFFLVFENQIDIPVYLQVFGRMHPLLLHFPIVLLFISWLLIFFRRQLEKTVTAMTRVIGGLIFISALFAAVTVIMGLFLSKEGGYEGSNFEWHKWTGVALSLLALILLYGNSRQRKEQYHPLFLVGMNLSLVLLVVVGHFGATLTHGDNFILAPLGGGGSNGLNMERDLVYEDAVYRILEAKCLSCHNENKPKGDLVLSDTASLLKGGKNGQLFVAGSPHKSLLMERLLLDIDHEHHMPPRGKPQLTDDELSLIQAWISNGARFNLPLSVLAEQDTLLQIVKAVYNVDDAEHYDFPPVDAGLIEGLVTPYLVIKPIAVGSPALAVNFYGREFFNPASLQQLIPIADRVVSLNLSGMPVGGDDLKVLKSFENLRELNLNYTTLDDEQLASVPSLPTLKRLNLSGTAITLAGARKILAMPTLRSIFLWDTPIDGGGLASLIEEFPSVYIDGGSKGDDSVQLPLTPPKITPSRSFFRKQLSVSFSHPIAGVEIRYTLDGSHPDSAGALIYNEPLSIGRNVTLRAKASKEGWASSDEVVQTYRDAPIAPDRVVLDDRPHHLFRGREGQSLFDMESGGANHADGKWIGFQKTNLSAHFFFNTPVAIDSLNLSVKQHYNEHNVFMYPPKRIEVWGGPDSNTIQLLAKISPELDRPGQVRARRMIPCPIKKQDIGYIKLTAIPYHEIPAGYPAAGRQAWLFLDEIVIN